MSDAADRRSSGGSGATWVVSVVGILVMYALSVGPVARMLTGIYGPSMPPPVQQVLSLIYSPLETLAQHCEPIDQFYMWYFKVWGV